MDDLCRTRAALLDMGGLFRVKIGEKAKTLGTVELIVDAFGVSGRPNRRR